jgi:hypothetical protein
MITDTYSQVCLSQDCFPRRQWKPGSENPVVMAMSFLLDHERRRLMDRTASSPPVPSPSRASRTGAICGRIGR